MKTYVINMLKDVGKRQKIEYQLKGHPELDSQIWVAIEGKKLTFEQQKESISPLFKESYGKSASLPAAGCSLSHIAVYRDIIRNNIRYALILEDDAILGDNLFLDSTIQLLDSDSPVAVLLTPEFWYHKKGIVTKADETHAIYSVNAAYMTSGYLINQAGASLLLKYLYPIKYTADAWEKFRSFGLQLFGIVPHVVSFPDEIGEIGAASNAPLTPMAKLRSKLILMVLKLFWIPKYISGARKSKIRWR